MQASRVASRHAPWSFTVVVVVVSSHSGVQKSTGRARLNQLASSLTLTGMTNFSAFFFFSRKGGRCEKVEIENLHPQLASSAAGTFPQVAF